MRRDGDRLVDHLAGARRDVLICAPFIKAGVMAKILDAIAGDVAVRVVTRWMAREVAAGVSDLEVFDVVSRRRGASLWLLDRLHAKIYLADDAILIGSANLTGAALGWSDEPNLELLTLAEASNEDIGRCLAELKMARKATASERDRVRAESLRLPQLDLADDARDDAPAALWLPRLGAPKRLYQAYLAEARDRLSTSVLQAALGDLAALGIPPGLPEYAFVSAVSDAFKAMPAVRKLLDAAEEELDDERGIQLISEMNTADELSPEQQWLVVREWMIAFLSDRYEIAPASFIVRRRPGRRA